MSYRALILRKTNPQLSELIDRSKEIYLPAFPNAKYNHSQKCWIFPSGAKIYFGSIQYSGDVIKFQGKAFQYIGFDELTHFLESEYMYLFSRCRARGPGLRCYIRASANPGGIGHYWVKKRFIDNGGFNTVKENINITNPDTNEKMLVSRNRIFIPSNVMDNKILMENDPNYLANLASLPEKEKQALLYGNWDSFEGNYFSEFSQSLHVIKPAAFNFKKKWLAVDYGFDMLSILKMGLTHDGHLIVTNEICKPNLTISQAAEEIKSLLDDEVQYITISPDLFHNRKQDTGKSGEQILKECGLRNLRAANNDRVPGWRAVREYLKPYEEDGIMKSKLKIFSTCSELIRCLPMLQHDEHNSEDASSKPHSITHAPEALRYGVMSINNQGWGWRKE